MKKMKGIIVAMTTPFDENGYVDLGAMMENTKWLSEKGVHSLYPCGTTGEMLLMNNEERKSIAETVVKAADGKTDVFVQSGAMTTRDTVELVRHARDIGADGVGIVTPAFFGLSREEMIEHYVTAASCAGDDFPVYLYNIPQCAGNDLTADIVREIADRCPNVLGIKYSYNNADRISDYLGVRNYDFSVLVGLEKHFLPYLSLGCDGVVSGCANAFPEIFLAIYNAFMEGDLQKALKIQRIEEKLSNLISGAQGNAKVKAAQRFRGQNSGHMRKPLLDYSGEELESFKAQLPMFMPENL